MRDLYWRASIQAKSLVLYAHKAMTAPLPGRVARRRRDDKAGALSTRHAM